MLTTKQQRFVEEYARDQNAEEAAKRAGFSPQGARRAGQRLLSLPHIQQALAQQRQEAVPTEGITRERVLQELASMAFSNGTDFVHIEDGERRVLDTAALSSEKRAAILAIRDSKTGPEVVAYDKLKALELLGKQLGMFDASKAVANQPDCNLLDAIRQSCEQDVATEGGDVT